MLSRKWWTFDDTTFSEMPSDRNEKKTKREERPTYQEQIGLCFIGVHKLDTLLNSRKFVS